MHDLKLKCKALELRRRGMTYKEIQHVLGSVPKSTISTWFKSIDLNTKQLYLLQKRVTDAVVVGRRNAAVVNHRKRLERITGIKKQANNEFLRLQKDGFFLTGLALYLAEGSKKFERFQFMNSDANLVKIMIRWVYKFGGYSKHNIKVRLYIHRPYAHEQQEKYWAKFLSIPVGQFYSTIYKPTPHKVKKNVDYHGCLRLEVPGSELYWKIMAWRTMLYQLFC